MSERYVEMLELAVGVLNEKRNRKDVEMWNLAGKFGWRKTGA
jgi:hypothetical protein